MSKVDRWLPDGFSSKLEIRSNVQFVVRPSFLQTISSHSIHSLDRRRLRFHLSIFIIVNFGALGTFTWFLCWYFCYLSTALFIFCACCLARWKNILIGCLPLVLSTHPIQFSVYLFVYHLCIYPLRKVFFRSILYSAPFVRRFIKLMFGAHSA